MASVDCFKGSYELFNLTNDKMGPDPLLLRDGTFSSANCTDVSELIPVLAQELESKNLGTFYFNLACDATDCDGKPLEIRVYSDNACSSDVTSLAKTLAGDFLLVTTGMQCGECDGETCKQTKAYVAPPTNAPTDDTRKGFSGLLFVGLITVITVAMTVL